MFKNKIIYLFLGVVLASHASASAQVTITKAKAPALALNSAYFLGHGALTAGSAFLAWGAIKEIQDMAYGPGNHGLREYCDRVASGKDVIATYHAPAFLLLLSKFAYDSGKNCIAYAKKVKEVAEETDKK